MKKILYFPKLIALFLITFIFLSNGCKKDETAVSVDACVANADLVSKTATTFSTAPTKTNCEAYIAAVNKYLDSCPGLTTAQRADYKNQLAQTKCQ
jgi:hypothetical protein